MREYAERLAKARPERYEFNEWDGGWMCSDHDQEARWSNILTDGHNDRDKWAFWGPLATEFGIGCLSTSSDQSLLECMAEMVCFWAERSLDDAKAKE